MVRHGGGGIAARRRRRRGMMRGVARRVTAVSKSSSRRLPRPPPAPRDSRESFQLLADQRAVTAEIATGTTADVRLAEQRDANALAGGQPLKNVAASRSNPCRAPHRACNDLVLGFQGRSSSGKSRSPPEAPEVDDPDRGRRGPRAASAPSSYLRGRSSRRVTTASAWHSPIAPIENALGRLAGASCANAEAAVRGERGPRSTRAAVALDLDDVSSPVKLRGASIGSTSTSSIGSPDTRVNGDRDPEPCAIRRAGVEALPPAAQDPGCGASVTPAHPEHRRGAGAEGVASAAMCHRRIRRTAVWSNSDGRLAALPGRERVKKHQDEE